ncbi:hypothetical protein DPMN_039535 [Dreissena polymorpha]|uniref:Uncharacterized protein n=1 Tax=Dreissena polymorpha TaxID=45954 RepID=A0A9D4CUB0_DREPO|nr:hypothetical protein DPMN_039535 [Dreissena polymorpha]
MIIDCKATVRRPYCDISTSFVRLLRPQNDYDRNKNAVRTPRTPLRRRMVGFGRRKDAQNAINQDTGVTRRRKKQHFYRKSHWRPY